MVGRVIYNLNFSRQGKLNPLHHVLREGSLEKLAVTARMASWAKFSSLFGRKAGNARMPADFRALELHVIRHGQCEHNVQGRFVGQGDSPLTEAGREQARQNGLLLRQLLGGARASDFIASPLHRACTTMKLVRGCRLPAGHAAIEADHRLMELDVGDHSWQLIADILKTPEHAAYSSDPWNYVRPNGESHAQLHRRVGQFLEGFRHVTPRAGLPRWSGAHDPRPLSQSLAARRHGLRTAP